MRLFTFIALALFLLSPSTQAAMTAGDATEVIRKACKSEATEAPERCDCYVDTLSNILPKDTYEPMIILAAIAMSGDFAQMQSFIEDYELDQGRFNAMQLEMQEAIMQAEKMCGA